MRKVTLVLGTGNRGKIAEFGRLLNGPWRLSDLSQVSGWEPVDEEGMTLAENAPQGRRGGMPAEAVGVGGRHRTGSGRARRRTGGPFRDAGLGATAEANRHRLLQQLSGIATGDRTASFVCHLALADPDGQIRVESTGRCRGRIRTSAAGAGGFGYDSLFEIVEYHLTLAELGTAASDCLTHRARAVEAIRPRLMELLAIGD